VFPAVPAVLTRNALPVDNNLRPYLGMRKGEEDFAKKAGLGLGA